MTLVERIGAGERKPDSVQRDDSRLAAARARPRPPATQIVLRVHFENAMAGGSP